jgi:hypothetical protein
MLLVNEEFVCVTGQLIQGTALMREMAQTTDISLNVVVKWLMSQVKSWPGDLLS